MTATRFQALFVGVGGQGVLTAAKVLGEAAHRAGCGVVIGQLHGMSQRGGSVECSVIVGVATSSFIMGAPDLLLAFEPLEALRALPRLGNKTVVVMNRGSILPPSLLAASQAREAYPSIDDVASQLLEVVHSVTMVDGPRLTAEVGEPRTLNVVMLGACAALQLLPFDAAALGVAAADGLAERYRSRNRHAFDLGRACVSQKEGAHG